MFELHCRENEKSKVRRAESAVECRVNAIRDEGAAADVWLLQEWSHFDGLLLPVMIRQRFRLLREPSSCCNSPKIIIIIIKKAC